MLGRQPRFVLYFKGEIKLIPNRYSPISILPCLSKVLETLVNNQLTGFLDVYSILSGMQSGFHSGYGCVTETLKVLNDVTIALDSKQCCTAIFIDSAKAFDMVGHSILVGQLRSFGVAEGTLLPVTKGVPQGSLLGPRLFSNYINNIAQAVGSSLVHLYEDDTVLYSAGPSPDFVLKALQ